MRRIPSPPVLAIFAALHCACGGRTDAASTSPDLGTGGAAGSAGANTAGSAGAAAPAPAGKYAIHGTWSTPPGDTMGLGTNFVLEITTIANGYHAVITTASGATVVSGPVAYDPSIPLPPATEINGYPLSGPFTVTDQGLPSWAFSLGADGRPAGPMQAVEGEAIHPNEFSGPLIVFTGATTPK